MKSSLLAAVLSLLAASFAWAGIDDETISLRH